MLLPIETGAETRSLPRGWVSMSCAASCARATCSMISRTAIVQRACFGQALLARVALEQPRTQQIFQLADLAADHDRGDAQLVAGKREVTCLDHCFHTLQFIHA